MWLPSKDLLASGAFNKQSLFIVQAWHELLTAETPDTFRSRVLDIFLLLEELARIVEFARLDPKWLTHVHAVCEEVDQEKGDFIDLLKGTSAAVTAIEAVAGFKEGQKDLPLLAERLRILAGMARDPKKLLIDDALVLATDEHRKKDLLRRLGTLATHIQRQGLAEESLLSLKEELLTKPPQQVIEALCAPLQLTKRTFNCFIAVSSDADSASSIFAESEFRQIGRNRLEATVESVDWYEKNRTSYLVEVQVSAMSKRLAAEIALAKINTLLNLVVLYANKSQHEISTIVLVEYDYAFVEVEVTPSKHFGLLPRRDSVRLARKRYHLLADRLEGRVSNILEAHALGIAAEDPRSAIINLWTALEAISGGGEGSIGERVALAVSPVVAWRRVDKIVSYLAIQMCELAQHQGQSCERDYLPGSTRRNISRIDLLGCLCGPAYNPGILAVLNDCSASPLLLFRMYAAWEELSDRPKLKATLRLSAKRTRWQVLRLYRARNLLVHKGERDPLVWRLLENAQYYVSTVVGRILQHLREQPDWTVDTSIESQRQRFEGLCFRLGSPEEQITLPDLLVQIPDDLRDLCLWGASSRYPGPYEKPKKSAPADAEPIRE